MSKLSVVLLGSLLGGVAYACSSPEEGESGGAVLEVVSPPPALVAAGDRMPGPVVVRAVDEAGNPVPGIRLEWSGDGVISPSATTTDDSGHASVRWTLPRLEGDNGFGYGPGLPGSYQLEVRYGSGPALRFAVEGSALKLDQVDPGPGLSCGVRSGRVWCWGGMLEGIVQVPDRDSYGDAMELTLWATAAEVAASEYSMCIRAVDGAVRCSSSWTGRSLVAVQALPPLVDLADGSDNYCGRAVDHAVWCWRMGGAAAPTATRISSQRFVAVDAGREDLGSALGFGCALDEDGIAWCWGTGRFGDLGNGTMGPSFVPVQVESLERWSSIDIGFSSACARAMTGDTWCWGGFNGSSVPVRVGEIGISNPALAVGDHGAIAWNGTAAVALDSVERYPLHGVYSRLGFRFLANDGQVVCALTVEDDTYCSWVGVYNGGDSSLFPSDLVAVPPLRSEPY